MLQDFTWCNNKNYIFNNKDFTVFLLVIKKHIRVDFVNLFLILICHHSYCLELVDKFQ